MVLRSPHKNSSKKDKSFVTNDALANAAISTMPTIQLKWTLATKAMCLVLAVFACVQFADLQKKTFRLVGGNIFLDMRADDLPMRVADWKNIDYQLESRTTDADFGERSDIWRYQTEAGVAVLSVDQTFRLWHDLLVCYKNAGWQLEKEEVAFGNDKSWPTVFASYGRRDGRHAILFFCLFDRSGLPLEVPGYLDFWSSIKNRLEKRFSLSAGELFREQTCYQVQVFFEADRHNSEQYRESVFELLEVGRERIRNVGLKRLNP